jgi:hypothetical protein
VVPEAVKPGPRDRVLVDVTKLIVMALMCGCLGHAPVRTVERPDPEVGDMTCAPPMSIDSLLHATPDQGSAIGPCNT